MEKPIVRSKRALALAFLYDYFNSNKTSDCQEKQIINKKESKNNNKQLKIYKN